MRQNGEPSVEEILQSIKHVIARDSREAVRSAAGGRREGDRPAPAFRPLADADDDVLDLAAEAEVTAHDEEIAAPAQADAQDEDGEPSLIQPEMRASMRDSLAALAMLSEPGAAPRIVRSGETSLEDLARELLRPALTQWLEAHLPQLVERMVSAEIARIVGKKG